MGDFWYLDGDYQRQADMEYNEHPVYKKEGYVWLVGDYYIFLHDADGDGDWYWAINRETNFTDDSQLRAICAGSDVSDPSLCPQWSTTGAFLESRNYSEEFKEYEQLEVSSGLCPVSDNYVCITSTQSNLGLFIFCFYIFDTYTIPCQLI